MLRFIARSLSGSRSYPLFTNPHLSVLEARAGRQQVFRRWASKERKSPGGQKVTGHWSGALKKYLRVIHTLTITFDKSVSRSVLFGINRTIGFRMFVCLFIIVYVVGRHVPRHISGSQRTTL